MNDPLVMLNFVDDGAGLRLMMNEGGTLSAKRVPDFTVWRLRNELNAYIDKIAPKEVSPAEGDPETRPHHDRY